jgi:hypothetical protein
LLLIVAFGVSMFVTIWIARSRFIDWVMTRCS